MDKIENISWEDIRTWIEEDACDGVIISEVRTLPSRVVCPHESCLAVVRLFNKMWMQS